MQNLRGQAPAIIGICLQSSGPTVICSESRAQACGRIQSGQMELSPCDKGDPTSSRFPVAKAYLPMNTWFGRDAGFNSAYSRLIMHAGQLFSYGNAGGEPDFDDFLVSLKAGARTRCRRSGNRRREQYSQALLKSGALSIIESPCSDETRRSPSHTSMHRCAGMEASSRIWVRGLAS